MKKILLFACLCAMVPALALAQTQWSYDGPLWNQVLDDAAIGSGHGVAVDPDGKIWFQPFSASDSVLVAELGNVYVATRVLYVFNPDGSMADISPIKFLDYPGGARDTLGGFTHRDANGNLIWEGRSGRGLRADPDGNILASQFNTLFRIDYKTGMGMNRLDEPDHCALVQVATDDAGNIFTAPVCPGPPIRMYDKDFNFLGNAVEQTIGFSRSFEVSPDGNSVLWAGYTNHALVHYNRPDEFSAFDSVGVVLEGMDSESMSFNPATGHFWVAAGSPFDTPNRYTGVASTWNSNTWYSFDLADVLDGNANYTPIASISWGECTSFAANVCVGNDGRPRGLAFSPDGETAYVTQFNQGAPSLEQFSSTPTAIERDDTTLPENFTLSQNFPNPFNPSTKIQFDLKEAGQAQLRVFDMMGREVAELVNEYLPAGSYTSTFEAQNLSSGTYLYLLDFNGVRLTGKMTLLK